VNRPALRYLRTLSDTLQREDFTVLTGHPSLEVIDANLRTDKLSYQVNQMLHLDPRRSEPVLPEGVKRELAARISSEQ